MEITIIISILTNKKLGYYYNIYNTQFYSTVDEITYCASMNNSLIVCLPYWTAGIITALNTLSCKPYSLHVAPKLVEEVYYVMLI